MKKFGLFAAASLMALAACQDNNGYTINGTVADAADGEYVYLQTIGRDAVVLDSAVVNGEKFQFKGLSEVSVMPKILIYKGKTTAMHSMVYLDKGTINVDLQTLNSNVSGTENNDALAKFMDEYGQMNDEMKELYGRYRRDTTLTDTQREELMEELEKRDAGMNDFVYNKMVANISKSFGSYLLVSFGSTVDAAKINELLPQIPAELSSDASLANLKEYVGNVMNTSVGKKFVDFSMKTPEGEDVKLSDFIGKDKYTLIDFWASWCGPCRNEMPNVVKAYNQYKSKGFGIVGVSLDQDVEKWKDAIKNLNITWPQMSDLKAWQNEGAKLYGVRGIPATVLVDQNGTIVARDLRGEDLINKLGELFK